MSHAATLDVVQKQLVQHGGSLNMALLAFIGEEIERQRKSVCVDEKDEITINQRQVGNGTIGTSVFAQDIKKNDEEEEDDEKTDVPITSEIENRAIRLLDANHANVIAVENRLISSPVCVCLNNGKTHKLVKVAKAVAEDFGPKDIDETSPLFAMVADKDLMEKLDLLTTADDDEEEKEEKTCEESLKDCSNSFSEVIRREILLGKIAPQRFWTQAMAKLKQLVHTRAHLSLKAAATALASNKAGVQYYVGGLSLLRSFAIETDVKTSQEMAVCVDAKVPLASHGDVAYDLIVSIPYDCVQVDKEWEKEEEKKQGVAADDSQEHFYEEKPDDDEAIDFEAERRKREARPHYGSVSLYFGKVCYETSNLYPTENGYQCRLLKNGIPSVSVRHMRARLSCKFPISPILDTKASLPNMVRFRVNCVLLPQQEKDFLTNHAVVIANEDGFSFKPWLFGNGVVAELEKKQCGEKCLKTDDEPSSLEEIYQRSMIDSLCFHLTGKRDK